jgi:hypothetical protein
MEIPCSEKNVKEKQIGTSVDHNLAKESLRNNKKIKRKKKGQWPTTN